MAIARREFLLLARSPVLSRSRFWTGVVTLVTGTAFAVVYSWIGNAAPLMGMVGYMISLTCMFTGAQITSDSLAKEKREGTLGLLFLTPLRPWEITLGKLIAFTAAAFSRIFVIFPLLSLLMIVSGARPGQLFQTGVGLLNILFTTACIGLYASTVSEEQKRAAGRATFLVLFFWWGLPLLAQAGARLGAPRWLHEGILLCSLHSGLVPAFIMPLAASSQPWLNMLCTHLVGWFFLAMATWRIRFVWQDKPEPRKFSIKETWRRLSYGNPNARLLLRQVLLERNPFLWLACRDRFRAFGLWGFTIAIFGFSLWMYYATGRQPGPMIAFWAILTVMHRFFAANVGGAQIITEQEQGTIEMLLSTPLSAREVLRGQFLAAVRQFRGPACAAIVLHLIAPIILLGSPNISLPVVIIVVVVSLAFYLLDLYTAIWLSMLGAVTSRNPKAAAGAAIARLFGFPFLTLAAVTISVALLNTFFNFQIAVPPAFIAISIPILMCGNNIFWIRRSHRILPDLLRTYAFRRYSPDEEVSFLGQVGRALGRLWFNQAARKANA